MKGFLKKGRNLLINDKQITPFFSGNPHYFYWTEHKMSSAKSCLFTKVART